MTKFDKFLFEGLTTRKCSNKYIEINRVSDDENKIIVKVSESQLIKTKYGYALILDNTRVVFLKDWQVQENWFGTEVVLTREYFNVKTWGNHEDFSNDDKNCSFDSWLEAAKEQQAADNLAKWIA